jgi:O-antigen ligase
MRLNHSALSRTKPPFAAAAGVARSRGRQWTTDQNPPSATGRSTDRAYHQHLKFFLILMLFGILLTPSLSIAVGMPKVRLEEVLIGVLLVYLLLRSLSGRPITFAWGVRQSMLLALPLFLFISIGVGLVMHLAGSLGDLNQLIRIIKYLVIYTVAVSVIAVSPDQERAKASIINWTLVFGCILTLVTTQQYYNLFGLNTRYMHLIAAEWEYNRLLEDRLNRPLGMVGNPNELGFLLAVVANSALYQILWRFRPFYLLALVLALIGILMTGSRSSLLACIAGCMTIGLLMSFMRLPAKTRFMQRLASVLGAVVLLALAGGLTSVYGDLLERFETLDTPAEIESWQIRLERWQENIGLFKQSPAFGVGPLRYGSIEFAADNEWWLLLRSYGIVGTLFLLAVFLLPHVVGRWSSPAALAFGLYVTSALYMVAAVVYHSLALMPLVLILIALSDTTVKAGRIG